MASDNNVKLDDVDSVGAAHLITLARKHNQANMQLLAQSKVDDVKDLLEVLRRTQVILVRCTADYGDLTDFDSKSIERVYLAICKYEKVILQLQQKGSLVRFITQSRLRSKLDQLCNSIFLDVTNLEKEIRESKLKSLMNGAIAEYTEMLDEIEQVKSSVDVDNKPILSQSPTRSRMHPEMRSSIDELRRVNDAETRRLADNELSIVADASKREQLLKPIPRLDVQPLLSAEEEVMICSQDGSEEAERCFLEEVCARSISTYPTDLQTKVRQGEPICDQYSVAEYPNRAILAVADGCGWGNHSRDAARKAVRMFLVYMRRHQSIINNTEDAARMLLRAYSAAQKSIVGNHTEEQLFQVGTTTMMAGIALELTQPQQGHNWAFVGASLGDCKAYVYSHASNRIRELTIGNRGNPDPRDPGGRLGPQLEGALPDLRNFTLYCELCDENDIIFIVSDGVHDNLDPKFLGKSPKDIGAADLDTWEPFSLKLLPEPIEKKVNEFSNQLINDLVARPVTPAGIVRSLITHANTVTANYRTFMENTPHGKIPSDSKQYPGKPDHTTCVALKIGRKKSARTPANNALVPPRAGADEFSLANRGVSSLHLSAGRVARNRSSGELIDLIKLDLQESKSTMSIPEDPSLLNPDPVPENDRYVLVWNKLFGAEAYHAEWGVFKTAFANAGFPLSAQEEKQLQMIIDYSNTGVVTRFKFCEFLKGFGPLEECVKNAKNVVSSDWFYGFISSTESKKFLEQHPQGTFLVRFSSTKPGSFVLDYVREPGSIRSVRFTSHPQGGFAAPMETGKERVFKSLEEIIQTYKEMKVLLSPLSSSLPDQAWFYGDITGDEAEQLLRGQPFGTFLIRFSQQAGCFAASFVGANGEVLKGLVTKHAGGGYQVKAEGMIFKTLDELVQHYKEQNIFTLPFVQ